MLGNNLIGNSLFGDVGFAEESSWITADLVARASWLAPVAADAEAQVSHRAPLSADLAIPVMHYGAVEQDVTILSSWEGLALIFSNVAAVASWFVPITQDTVIPASAYAPVGMDADLPISHYSGVEQNIAPHSGWYAPVSGDAVTPASWGNYWTRSDLVAPVSWMSHGIAAAAIPASYYRVLTLTGTIPVSWRSPVSGEEIAIPVSWRESVVLGVAIPWSQYGLIASGTEILASWGDYLELLKTAFALGGVMAIQLSKNPSVHERRAQRMQVYSRGGGGTVYIYSKGDPREELTLEWPRMGADDLASLRNFVLAVGGKKMLYQDYTGVRYDAWITNANDFRARKYMPGKDSVTLELQARRRA